MLEKFNIFFYVIPANISFVTQPLDVVLFSAFKSRFKFMNEIDDVKRVNNLAKILESYHIAYTPNNILSSFASIGIELKMSDDCSLNTVYIPDENTGYVKLFGLQKEIHDYRTLGNHRSTNLSVKVDCIVNHWKKLYSSVYVDEDDGNVDDILVGDIRDSSTSCGCDVEFIDKGDVEFPFEVNNDDFDGIVHGGNRNEQGIYKRITDRFR